MRVLICEDNWLIALGLQQIVADLGHECCGVSNTYDGALQTASEAGAEVALVDLDLADGWTGLRVVDALAERGTPAIIVSGQAESIDRPHRAVGILSKPVDVRALAAVLDSVAAGRGG